MYIITYDTRSGKAVVVRQADEATIPRDPGNRHWRAFLAWNAQQAPPLDLADRPAATEADLILAAKEEAKAGKIRQTYWEMLWRGSLRVGFSLLVEIRNKINQIIDRQTNPAIHPIPAKLPGRTWRDLLAAVDQQIDAETDPNQ